MSHETATPWYRRWETARWGACFLLALGFHGAGAAALVARWNDHEDLLANAPVISIDLAPVAVAPTTTPTEVPPDQVESKQVDTPDPKPEKPIEEAKTEAEPEPEKPPEKVEQPPDNNPKPELAVMPPPKPVEKPKEKKEKPKHRMASVASAPSAADKKAERAAAPMPGANSNNPNAVPNWMSLLSAQLERHKRMPSDAQTGVVMLAFSVDRSGGVHNSRIVRSSGSGALDQAALAMVARAAPLPPPPPERPGAQIAITVPVRFTAR